MAQLRPLAGIEPPRLQRLQQGLRRILLGLDHHPAAKGIRACEMRIIRGDQIHTPPRAQQQVGGMQPVAPVHLHRAAVIVDLHRMGRLDRQRIRLGQPRPMRMRHRDEGPRVPRPRGDLRPALLPRDGPEMRRIGGREIGRKPDRQDMPQLAVLHHPAMQLRARKRGEAFIAKRGRVGDGIAVEPDEMIGERDEIIPLRPVAAAHLLRLQHPVRQGRMGVQIATKEPAGGGECIWDHRRLLLFRPA